MEETTVVTKKFGLALYVEFKGSIRAIDTFTQIHREFSNRGYGLVLPEEHSSRIFEIPGIGRVQVSRLDEEHCEVYHLAGRFQTRIKRLIFD
jgi:hypothetical protein